LVASYDAKARAKLGKYMTLAREDPAALAPSPQVLSRFPARVPLVHPQSAPASRVGQEADIAAMQ